MAVGFVMIALAAACLGGLATLCLGAATACVSGLCSGMLAPLALAAIKLASHDRGWIRARAPPAQ